MFRPVKPGGVLGLEPVSNAAPEVSQVVLVHVGHSLGVEGHLQLHDESRARSEPVQDGARGHRGPPGIGNVL
jgi:hypothetical protein